MRRYFKRADVAVRALGAGDAALVEVVDRRGVTGSIVRRVKRGAACAERHRLSEAAVIL